LNVTHGEITSMTDVPLWAMRGLQDRLELLHVARERARDERAAELDREGAQVDRDELVHGAALPRRAEVGRRGELALREAVDAVVLDDVDERQVPAHEVDELADPDRGRVAVAGDADPDELRVRDEGARRGGRHAAVDAVEAPGAVQEVGGRLRGAADAGELRDLVGRDAHLVEGGDDLLRDDVVPAAEAERRLRALVVGLRQADAVRLRRGGRGGGGRSGRLGAHRRSTLLSGLLAV
jgi:hypothetical protein